MIEYLPVFVPATFILTTFLTLGFLFYALWVAQPRTGAVYWIAAVLIGWMALQGVLGLTSFHSNTSALPPRMFAFGAFPALLTVISLCFALRRSLIPALPLGALTLIHIIRVPVEMTLYWLYELGFVPIAMTYAGTNFDIISGLTAPLAYLIVKKNVSFRRPVLIAWNIGALLLLVNIVGTAILAFPSPLQQIAFDRPNVAVTYFPFVWLPTVIVPIVLFAHIASLTTLIYDEAN